jgi:hypothetical protein
MRKDEITVARSISERAYSQHACLVKARRAVSPERRVISPIITPM